jgi:hypothetical protein
LVMKLLAVMILFIITIRAQGLSPQDQLLSGCWVTLFNETSFAGSGLTLFHGYDQPELEFSTDVLEEGEIKSLIAGSTAQLKLYPGAQFKGTEYLVHPGSDLSRLPWETVSSFKLNCVSLEEGEKIK